MVVKKSIVKKPIIKNRVIPKEAFFTTNNVGIKNLDQKILIKKPIIKKRIIPKKPIIKKRIIPKMSIVKKPIVKKPVLKKPIVKKPVLKKPVVKKPIPKRGVVKKKIINNKLVSTNKNSDTNKLLNPSINTNLISTVNTIDNIKHIFKNIQIDNKTFIWEADKNIELTVALPAYNSKNIIYLALESLKNQTNINFNWELIIVEEDGLSYDLVKTYQEQLPGCKRIVYVGIRKRILLIEKWKSIALLASNTSKVYVLQAADCYSSPKRLYIHYQHFKNRRCYFSTQLRGLFYNLLNNKKVFYDGGKIDNKRSIKGNHLNMALRTPDIKALPLKNIKKGIDSYIRNFVKRRNKITANNYIFADTSIDGNNWKYSIDTDGANNISLGRRKNYTKPNRKFVSYNKHKRLGYISMEKYIPGYIVTFLKKYR